MATYTVTWEEFLEIHQDSLPQPSITSFVSTIFIATAVGTFGAVLTCFADPGEKLLASAFLWLSLLLFVAAFWDLKMRTMRRRDKAIQGLQSVHKRHHSSVRTFEFDQAKWMCEGESGKQEVPWTALHAAVERRSVVELMAKDRYAVVPKRSLDQGQLEQLRQIALKRNGDAWALRVGLFDYVLTEVSTLWRRCPFLMAEAHAGGLLFVLLIAYGMYGSTGPGVIWGWMLAGLLLFLTITTQFGYFLIKYQTSHKHLRETWEAEFSNRGVFLHTPRLDFFGSWGAFKKHKETRRCFLLYATEGTYYLCPKRCLSPDQQGALRELLQKNLTAEGTATA